MDMGFTVDDLAQEIRRVDGNHSLGAGALAEALMPFIERRCAAPEMLAALYSAVASIEQLVRLNRIPANNKGLRDARAAIAKAEGRADA